MVCAGMFLPYVACCVAHTLYRFLSAAQRSMVTLHWACRAAAATCAGSAPVPARPLMSVYLIRGTGRRKPRGPLKSACRQPVRGKPGAQGCCALGRQAGFSVAA